VYQIRTDVLSVAAIVGATAIAGGATLALADSGEDARVASECAHVITADREHRRVVVALGSGAGSMTMTPDIQVKAEACASVVRATNVERVEARVQQAMD